MFWVCLLQLEYFREQGRFLEAKRLEERVNFDLEMIRELGYCNGIENYSRYFDRREGVCMSMCLRVKMCACVCVFACVCVRMCMCISFATSW